MDEFGYNLICIVLYLLLFSVDGVNVLELMLDVGSVVLEGKNAYNQCWKKTGKYGMEMELNEENGLALTINSN